MIDTNSAPSQGRSQQIKFVGFTGSILGMNFIGCVQTMYVEDHEFVEYGNLEMFIRYNGSYHQKV